LNVEIQQRAVEYGNLFNYDDIRKGVLERMPAPEIREENRVLGESPKKGKARRAQAKQSAPKDLVDILGGGLEEKEPENLIGQQDKNAELLKDLFGPSSPQRSTQPPRSNVSDIIDLFGNGSQGIIPGASLPPALSSGGGGFSNVDELFGRTAAPTPSTQSFGLRLLFLANHSSCGCIFQERSYSVP
jgi:AP-1 complex subunit gamma-1